MDKRDLFIKSKLQEDKNIPKDINELIKSFKGGDIKMENNFNKSGKGKVAKIIAIAACFILVALVGVVLLGQQNGQIIKVGGKDKVEGRKEVEIKNNEENNDREKWEILSTASILTKNRFEMAEFGGLTAELITPEINYEKNGDVVKVKFLTMPVFNKKVDNEDTVYDVSYTFEYKNNSLILKNYMFNGVDNKLSEFKEHQEYIQLIKDKVMEHFNTDHYNASELIIPEVRYNKQGNEILAEFLVAPIMNKNYTDIEVFKGSITFVQENDKWVEKSHNFHHAFEERWTLNIPQKMLELEIENSEIEGASSETEATNKTTQTIKKQDKTKNLVYDLYNEKGKKYDYKVPYINIDSNDVKDINQKILEKVKDDLKQARENDNREDYNNSLIGVEYDAYTNDNILSVIISYKMDYNDVVHYDVYNIDIYTGKIVSNLDILKKKNITQANFLQNVKKALEKTFRERYKDAEDLEYYQEYLNNTISDNNYSIDIPMFLDNNYKLNVIGYVYALAGPQGYDCIINLGI